MTARELVTGRIAEQARRFPDWLNIPPDYSALDARDAALAAAIEHEVMRRWLTLVAVLESRLSRPWVEVEFKLQAALLVGSAQLLLLDRLPDHAVINEAVEWAKQNVRANAGGMVNAVLRKVAGLRGEFIAQPHAAEFQRNEFPIHDGRILKLNEPVFDERQTQRLAQQTSHAESLLTHWMATFGAEQTSHLARHSLVHPPIIVHGVPNGSDELTPHDEPGFFVFTGGRDGLSKFLDANPGVVVQDSTSAAMAIATAEITPSPGVIIDACAGMGTKTRQLAMLHPKAHIIATDIAEQRIDVLRRQFAGVDHVQIIEHNLLNEHVGTADLLLLDVPCSNTGVLARRVEAKYRFTRQSQETIAQLQRQIIADSLTLLSESGRLVYSTCSIDPAENQQQAQWVCKWHPLRVAREYATLPHGLPGGPARSYRDGGYYAILEKAPKK